LDVIEAGDTTRIERSIALAESLLIGARRRRGGSSGRRQRRFRRLLSHESGTRLVFALADRVLRPVAPDIAAGQLADIAATDLSALPRLDQIMLHTAGAAGHLAPRPVVALAKARIRFDTRSFVAPLKARPLAELLRGFHQSGRTPNLNILGEMILGWDEAEHRRTQLESLLQRPDVPYISVKMSAVAPGLSLVDFEGSLARAAAPLRSLYRIASGYVPHKLITLDMEEHRDLDLTVALFTRVLSEPEFADFTAGIAIQAYAPDSHEALDVLLDWAGARKAQGGAPIRIRLVKGANLAMERVEAEQHGWPTPTYLTKLETDASYKLLLERLIRAAAAGVVDVGVASHNLLDLAYALLLSEELGGQIRIEMLAGMADDQADEMADRLGNILVYLPITSRSEFHTAMAYLARRLDENATPDGFLRHALDLTPEGAAWGEQTALFADAVVGRHRVSTARRQLQDRTSAATPVESTTFFNEADTDLTVPANRAWAQAALSAPVPEAPKVAGIDDVDATVARSAMALEGWSQVSGRQRRKLLLEAADRMVDGRHDAIAAMAQEAGKTFAEADPEVSEAIDFARWYAHGIELLDGLGPSADSEPLGVVVVAPPWNFPFAIPAGGVLAALAAGNTVILKPSPEARATGAVLVSQLHRAGFEPGCIQLAATNDDDAGRRLITHPDVGGVILTGSWDTAATFARWAPSRRILAETNGKNAMVISGSADIDAAVRDLVRSAFSHAGQKCSAASLAIVDASIYDRSPFLRQLSDATRSLRIGSPTDPATEVGPIVGPITPALIRALTTLDPHEQWLVEPRQLDERLWTPGVRIGVQPGSWAHRTEWFGPVLGVMRVSGLDEAIHCQNAVDYGLTGGLHSLDPTEQRRWIDEVESGNLYVNRHITGAIVGRQPFGGWKRSAFGPTAKAGGPNYLLSLRRWGDRRPAGIDDAVANYERAMQEHFSKVIDLAGLQSESNELRYQPLVPGVTVRIASEVSADEVGKARAAAAITTTAVRFSSPRPRPDLAPLVAIQVESDLAFAERLRPEAGRLRLLGHPEDHVVIAAAQAGVTVIDEPMCSEGRIELPRWLREQSICRSLHRYGSVVYPRLELGGPAEHGVTPPS
jgi:RHH-type transcriptional regulator, proline utilization regulon repressor / proline dehydrogenase / delta 1-pyrroline-5-carboxylate dehydrogenase